MNKLDMKSKDIVKDNLEYIRERFPEAVTEENGELKLNPDSLIQSLSSVIIDDKKEKYELTWPGKKQAIVEGNTRTTKTLRPLKDKSVDFDKTENIYIEGDNLEALKILQASYLNRIKCIYIDPPYNTGNDFIYSDNFKKTSISELEDSGQVSEAGKMVSNPVSNGKFHSDWLTMMYSRLKLARNLMTNDGLIFISIDDNELFDLKLICDQIFGESNFVNNITVKMSELSGVKMKNLKKFPKLKESLLIYSKNSSCSDIIIEKHKKSQEQLSSYLRYYSSIITNITAPVNEWNITSLSDYFKENNISFSSDSELNDWKIKNADKLVYRTNSRTVDNYLKNNSSSYNIEEIINNDGNSIIRWDNKQMLFLSDYIDEYLGDIWMDISTINLNKETDIRMFENGQKPLYLIERVLKTCIKENDIVLDFFSGSATTAHAVMNLCANEKYKNKYIMVQIPDDIEDNEYGFKTLCDIGEERIRRAAKKIKNETNADIDYGFRVYKIDDSNMKDEFYLTPDKVTQEQIKLFENNIKDDRTPEDLLTQVILNLGLKLDLPIEEKDMCGNKVFDIDDGELLACFDNNVNINIIEEIAKINPRQVVFRDSSFATDQDKVNFEERLKRLSARTKFNVL